MGTVGDSWGHLVGDIWSGTLLGDFVDKELEDEDWVCSEEKERGGERWGRVSEKVRGLMIGKV